MSNLKVRENLITVDGIDGSGKTSLLQELGCVLAEKHGPKVVLVRYAAVAQPSGLYQSTPSIDQFREYLKTQITEGRRTNALFVEASDLLYRDLIIPSLDAGKIVIIKPISKLGQVERRLRYQVKI